MYSMEEILHHGQGSVAVSTMKYDISDGAGFLLPAEEYLEAKTKALPFACPQPARQKLSAARWARPNNNSHPKHV